MKYLMLLILFTITLWGNYSQELTSAMEVYNNPSTRTDGIRLMKIEADKGDSIAQYVLGEAYAYRNEYSNAIKYYELSSDQGFSAASVQLGLIYYTGKGVSIDKVKAFKYTLKAAKSGNAKAQNNLEVMQKENPELLIYLD